MGAEKIYACEGTPLTKTKNGLTQMSQVVSAVLVHVRCSQEAPRLLASGASRCYFVGSSCGLEKTAQLGDHWISIFSSAVGFPLLLANIAHIPVKRYI